MALPYAGDFYRSVGSGRPTTAPIIPPPPSSSRPVSRPGSRPSTPGVGTENKTIGSNPKGSSSTPTLSLNTTTNQGVNGHVKSPLTNQITLEGLKNTNTLDNASSSARDNVRSSSKGEDFNFTVPSFPPRLANFGRKISQLGTDFINDLNDDSPWENKPKTVLPVEIEHEVPGMGDEPVMCPFCEKPLPPALLVGHGSTHTSKPPKRPEGLKRSNTTTGIKGGTTARSGLKSGLLDPLPVGVTRDKEKIDHSSVEKITSDSLSGVVSFGEGANVDASMITISEQDLERWSSLAGIPLPKPVQPQPTSGSQQGTGKPRLEGLGTRPETSRTSSTSSARFGFFKQSSSTKKDIEEEDEDSDDDGAGAGYARLIAAGSDTEDEGDQKVKVKPVDKVPKEEREEAKVVHDEPEEFGEFGHASQVHLTDEQSAQPRQDGLEKEVSNEDLKLVLKEVLSKVADMTKSHGDLLSSQSALLTSLKIARSNLVMAEANTEMLEAQIKQQTAATPKAVQATPVTPTANPRVVPTSTGIARRSEERQRPTSAQLASAGGISSSVPEKSGWGFWNKDNKKKLPGGVTLPSPSQFANALPSPSTEKRSFDLSGAAPYSAALPPQDVKRVSSEGMQRSASYTHLPLSPPKQSPMGPPPVPITAVELAGLKRSLGNAEAQIQIMNRELNDMKKGKLEMEAELENLSQALFEEANKMVAEERRKLFDVTESLKEVKEERDALKQTIKVLGGQGVDDSERSVSISSQESGQGVKKGDLPDEFVPRDLDKHYEALRKSIHHVSDGASNPVNHPSELAKTILETTKEEEPTPEMDGSQSDGNEKQAIEAESGQGGDMDQRPKSVIVPLEDSNPWANPSPFPGFLPGEKKLGTRNDGLDGLTGQVDPKSDAE